MYRKEFFKGLQNAREHSTPVAVATVVRREAPTSGKPGDKAIITEEGDVHGWIGGGCTKGIIIKEALECIKDRSSRLVRIQTDLDAPELPGVKNYKMTCMSGGTVEVFVEPMIPTMEIQIFGRSHIAQALANVGHAAGYGVSVISEQADPEMFEQADRVQSLTSYLKDPGKAKFSVVCTQGEDDEKHLKAALDSGSDYVAFVSSKRKANAVLMALKRGGVPHHVLVSVKTPAGLDIQAKTPEEVAISILAEIIQYYRSNEGTDTKELEASITDDLYINPVCKIPVQKSTAKHIMEYEGEKVYFCCDGCKESFEADPEKYMEV
jgi:xanthine dehydrogenase accessory factor